jgi:glycosyltransferase involved in cell wall biosynthesis
MCRALEAVGVRSMIATTDADGQDHLQVSCGVPTTHEGVPAIFFERVGPDSFKWARGMGRWLRTHVGEYDLVHIHGVMSFACLAAARACRRAGVPYLIRPLGTLDPWSLGRHAWRKRLLLAAAGRSVLLGSAAIHFTSEDERLRAQRALSWLPPGIVVPLGIEDATFVDGRVPESKELPYVLAMSRLDRKKGIDLLIRAFHEAAAGLPDWRLVIAGDGSPEYVSELKQLAATGPAASRITFCGWLDGEARRTWLHGATVFALPSCQENFGIAVVEAMAAGVAVLVTPSVAFHRQIREVGAGWVCERDDVARTLSDIVVDPRAAAMRGHLARQFADQFRWTRVATALAAVYGTYASRTTTATAAPVAAPAGALGQGPR